MPPSTWLTRISWLLIITGSLALLAKALAPESIDAAGVLHEPFFLLPIGFLLLFLGGLGHLWAKLSRRH